MDITLEELNEKNSREIVDIYNYYVLNSVATYGITPMTVDEFYDYYKLNDVRTMAKAIAADGTVIGICLLKPFDQKKEAFDRTCEYTVYIHPDYCGKGIGKIVYGMTEKLIAGMNITTVLAVVCAENTASRKMFESVGFECSGILRRVGFKFGRYLDLCYYQKFYQ